MKATLTRMEKSVIEMIGGWLCEGGWTPLKFQLFCMRTKFLTTVMVSGVVCGKERPHHDFPIFLQGLRVNTDADAYVGTLQAIVKSPWIDSVANEDPFHLPISIKIWLHPIKLSKPRIGWPRLLMIV
ncbi:hypothetical protein ACTXT7_002849 [Hymenolepis weldensis]